MNRSYLKYAGSKSRILPRISEILMDCSDEYKLNGGELKTLVEPFFGSGVVAMNVPHGLGIYNDSNKDLIDCHRAIIQNSDRVIELCEELWVGGRDTYYKNRERFRNPVRGDSIFIRAALFIYLNRFGFNGMVRYNLSGQFNVPVGKPSGDSPPLIPHGTIKYFSKNINLSELNCYDFEEVMVNSILCGTNATIYCDPPYVNLEKTGEIKYTKGGFNLEEQKRLANTAEKCRDMGARVLVSNHDLPVTRELYKNATRIVEIEAFRSISSKSATRGKAKELVAIYE